MAKHISAYTGVKRISAPTMTAVSTDKQSTGKRVSAFRNYALDREIAEKKAGIKNKGGLIGGAGYTLEKGALGAIQNVEGAADFVTAGAADLVGADELAEKIMDDDWVDYGHADKWYNPDKGMQVVGDVSGAIGSMIPNLTVAGGTALVNAALTAVTHGGYAAAVPWVQRIVPSLYAGISAAGNATKEAYRQTGELGFKEWGYGGLVGATEAGVEALTAGIGKGTGRLVAKFGKKAVGEATEAVGKYGIKGLLKTLGGDMISEGFEEGFATFMSPIYAKATYDPDAEMATAGEVFYDAAIGSIAGLIFSGADVAVSFGSSVDAGKKVSDAGKADKMVKQATYGLAQIRVEMEGAQSKLADVEASNELTKWGKARQKKQIKRTAENRAQASKAIEEALLRWESLTPEQRKSVKGYEVLGDLQKNDFLLRANAWVETRAGALSEQSDEGLSRIAEQIRESTGEMYTVEELRANKDDVLTRIACSMLAITGLENGEATQNAAQGAQNAAQDAESDGLTEWEGLTDRDDMTPYGARSEAEGYLLAAAVREGVPKASIPAMMEAYRAGTSLSPEEFVDGWLDAVKLYGNGAAGHASYAPDSALGRMTESQRAAAMEQGRLYGEAQARAKAKSEAKVQTDAKAKAEAKKEKTSDGAEDNEKSDEKMSFGGIAEDGKRIYKSNFPKGTPKSAKSKRILQYIKDVWSKEPIPLVISNGETSRTIYAQFDPTVDESQNVRTDASKLAAGNRHGTAGEKRVTLDLADDYYDIASSATYNYSKLETGKDSETHKDVIMWHYFVEDIYFSEYDSDEKTPYTVTINVKEKANGDFVYSFNAEKESPTRRTLHADVNTRKGANGELFLDSSISQSKPIVNRKNVDSSKKAPGRVILEDGLNVRNDFNDRQYASYKAAQIMAKVLGVDIVFHRSLHHGADVAAGYFSPKDGSIHININAMRDGENIALYTLGHETVHYIKEWSPRKYAELESFVLRKLTEAGQDVKALEEAKREQLKKSGDLEGLTEEQADALVREEVVAEAMEGVLSDGEVLADLQKRHRSLWEKIRDFVLSVIDKVKAAFNNLSGASQTARVLRDTVDALDGMKQLFHEGVVEAAEARASGAEGSTGLTRRNAGKMQVTEVDKDSAQIFQAEFEKNVDAVLNNTYQSDSALLLGRTPQILINIGLNQLPVAITPQHVYTIAKSKKEAKQEHRFNKRLNYHGLGANAVKQIMEKLSDPVMILAHQEFTKNQQEQHMTSRRVMVFVDFVVGGKQVICPIEVEATLQHNSNDVNVNLVATYFDKEDVSTMIKEAIAKENNGETGFYYIKQEKADSLLQESGYQLPRPLANKLSAFGYIIRHIDANVNRKIEHFTQSKQFIKFFGDWQNTPSAASKVVNKDGTPKILYHQTDGDFSEFDPRRQGAGTTDDETPFGIFMKPTDADIGLKGKKQMALYARIVNPLEVANRHELAQKLRTLSPEYARLKDEISALSVEYQAKIDQAAKDQEQYVAEYKEAHPDSPSSDIYNDQRFNELFDAEDHLVEEWETKANSLAVQCKEEITKALKENGYDGVIIRQDAGSFGRSTETYIALDPEQVKSATDNVGTYDGTNPDIYWSAGGDITESTDVSENASPYFKAAVERAGIDPESEAMIRSIEDSSKDLREDERAAWQADVERLGSYVKAQKAAAVSPAFTPKAMENAVGKVMSVIGAKRGRAELTERMTELYRHIATSDTLTYEDIMERAEAIADELIEAQPPTPVPVDGVYGDILTDLKQTPMTLTSTQMQEVADRYGSYENFRRKMFGKWKLSKDGVALDVLWQEWAGQYPEFFDPDMTEGDMVDALVKIYDEAYRAQNAVEYIEKAAVLQPLTMAIYNGYWELPAAPDPLYAAYQKDLAEQRGEADREQQRALARQRGEHKRAMAELQKQHERRIQKMNARMKELMRQRDRMELGQKVSTQTKEITVRTRAARRVLGRLNTMFFNQTKTKHVPQALRSLVEQVLSSEDLGDFQTLRKHMREISELESKIEQLEREPALTGEQQKKLDAMRYRYDELASASLAPKAQVEALFKAFEEYNQKANKGATLDADLMKRLSDDVKAMEGKPLSEMGVESVRAVEDFYKLLYHQINNANTLFAEERAEQISQLGDASVKEVEGSKLLKFLSPKEMEWAGLSSVRRFIIKNLKPLTVFEATGSKTLMGLFQRVLDGEGVWASDVQGVHEKIKGIREKYGWQSWKMDERVAVETKSGTVRLSLSEMMSLYAYSFREQAISHLEGGGFVLDPSATAKGKYPLKVLEQKVNDARRYVMDMETMGALASQLSEEQKSYVKEMQAVLTEMGELGNEVSRKLYDVDLFNEKHYFPIKVRSDYLESQTGRTGDPNIKNRGAFKQTVPDADNPLVLEAFDKVFADHVNSMATYHAFVLPVEDLMRVFNYNPSNASVDEQGNWVVDESAKSYSTVKAAISGRYGEDVVKYIEQVVRDLNGGARRDATASILDSGITAFKRASTMASLSVLIQQPTSLIRAGAYIDYKYLMNTKGFIDLKDHKANWERLCKYAPVGVIKEMGGYDTGVGARTTEYLNAKEYKTLSERAGAFFKPEALGGDANYRAEIFGRGAAFADEVAWIQMFEACVSEQAEKLKKPRDAEEVLTAAGERFTEIVRRTQVYDSTLTRSELMRSKDTGMKMATAFGAEPTTIVSMVADAIIRGERGDVKFLRKSGGALAAAIIINAMAVSLVYAMRDDDEDKTYAEKYLSTLSAEIVEGFIPLSYLPFARDVMSLAQGYEVERSDMTLIGNLFDQMKLLTSSKRSVTDKVLGVTGAVSAFFGLPVTNMVRDAKGLINTFLGQVDTERTTGAGVSAALKEEFTTIFGLFDEQTTNQYQLYDAVMRGDVAHYERVAARYDSEKAVEQALRKALRENDPRIHEAAVARIEGELEVYESLIAQIEGEGHFDRDIIIRAINNQINYINDHAEDETVPKDEAAAAEAEEELHEALYSASDLNAALERGDTEDFIAMADILVYYKIDAGKTEAQAKASIKSSVTRYWKEKWIEAWKNNDTAEIKRIQSVLVSTRLYGDRHQVAELGQGWVKAYAAKAGLVSVSGSQTAGSGRIRLGN